MRTADETKVTVWLSVAEVAKRVALSKASVYALVKSGELPAVRLGGVLRIRRKDFSEFIERSKVVPRRTPPTGRRGA